MCSLNKSSSSKSEYSLSFATSTFDFESKASSFFRCSFASQNRNCLGISNLAGIHGVDSAGLALAAELDSTEQSSVYFNSE